MTLETPKQLVKSLVDAGFSQKAIADRAGVRQPTISRILSGEHINPKSSVLINLKQFVDEIGSPTQKRRAADEVTP